MGVQEMIFINARKTQSLGLIRFLAPHNFLESENGHFFPYETVPVVTMEPNTNCSLQVYLAFNYSLDLF